jgi:3-hydroxyisobutyrate dehydrogenase-like beta-hydroxyacid dehydrogenase
MKVVVIGMGRMGAAMARRLAGTGHEVTVFNRNPERAAEVAAAIGGLQAVTAAAAAGAAPVVLTCLADDDAVRQVYLAEDGIAAGVGSGSVVVDMSTIDPMTVAEIRLPIRDVGADLVDAPVSGSVALVEQGTLTVMAGGETASVDRVLPVLNDLAKTVFHMGPSGSGSTMKLAVNALVHSVNIAVSEALVLAEKAGVDRSLAYDVFAAGAGGSPFVAYKRAAFLDPDSAPVAFSLDLVAKDLSLIRGLAQRVGALTPLADTEAEIVAAAMAAGLGTRDMSVVAEHLRR